MIIKLCFIIALLLIVSIIPISHGIPQNIDIEVGDIVLMDGGNITSGCAVRLISRSKFAHIGIINRIVDDEPYVLHCVSKLYPNDSRSCIIETMLFSQKVLSRSRGIYIMKNITAYNYKKYQPENVKKYNNAKYSLFSGLIKKSNYYNCITFIQHILAKYNISLNEMSVAFCQFNSVINELISRNLFHRPILIYSQPTIDINYIKID